MQWVVRRVFRQGRQMQMLHDLTGSERTGRLSVAEEHDELRHRHARVVRLKDLRGEDLVPALWDFQLMGALGGLLSLVGIERDTSVAGSVLQFGQTWLIHPAPNVEHERELSSLRAAMSEMAKRLPD